MCPMPFCSRLPDLAASIQKSASDAANQANVTGPALAQAKNADAAAQAAVAQDQTIIVSQTQAVDAAIAAWVNPVS